MIDKEELKNRANELRKTGKTEEALELYKKLWSETGDKFDGAGLLHCLRKLNLFNEAIPLADDLVKKFSNFPWCKNEIVWTYIKGQLDKLSDNEPLNKVIAIAEKIMGCNPKEIAAKTVVFKVLKYAKAANDWDTVNEWVVKIKPESLGEEPRVIDSAGKRGWSEQAQWYNYRIKGLIEDNKTEEALKAIEEIIGKFPNQRKYFLHLKASAFYKANNLQEAERMYREICSGFKIDWWLLHAYARVLRDKGQGEEALKLMYRAANSHTKLEAMVKLFADIGFLCNKIGKNIEARNHLILSKLIREKNGWSVDNVIRSTIQDLNELIGNADETIGTLEALKICRAHWASQLGDEHCQSNSNSRHMKARKRLIGKVNLGKADRPFCFIFSEGKESFFCFKSSLPSDIKNGDEVVFTAVPSFDKKKGVESWKAVNIEVSNKSLSPVANLVTAKPGK